MVKTKFVLPKGGPWPNGPPKYATARNDIPSSSKLYVHDKGDIRMLMKWPCCVDWIISLPDICLLCKFISMISIIKNNMDGLGLAIMLGGVQLWGTCAVCQVCLELSWDSPRMSRLVNGVCVCI